MKIKAGLRAMAQWADRGVSWLYAPFAWERPALLVFMFHAVIRPEDTDWRSYLLPTQAVTLEELRRFIEYYLGYGYTFIGPGDLRTGLSVRPGAVMITFDDGYANNQYVLGLLREYKVPALFCIATNYLRNNKLFWWDALYRQCLRRGISLRRIASQIEGLTGKRHDQIEAFLVSEFGSQSLSVQGDSGRPFRLAELKDFSRQPYVYLGNHTADHAILVNYSAAEATAQIRQAQDEIDAVAGYRPQIISYPNGNYSPEVMQLASEAGLDYGLTAQWRKNYFPIEAEGMRRLQLGRFYFQPRAGIAQQARVFRSDIRLLGLVSSLRQRGYGR